MLATTDDPVDDLEHHARLAADPTFATRVLPTFRPDRYLEPARADFPELVKALGVAADVDTSTYAGYLAALEDRRRWFKAHGGVSTDHSHADVVTLTLEPAEAARIYAAALSGAATAVEATAFRRHMLVEMARMATEDGLVMTLHPGVHRNHHTPTASRFGPDTGHDIPVAVEFTNGLQPLLERFGTAEGFQLVLFTLDETVFSREIAPLAGFYPSVYAGAPWWFLDAPEAVRRFRGAVTETAGFSRTSGFVDDTRAFLSIPARHDMSRRLDAAYLAQLVAEHRLDEDEALETAVDLVTTDPDQGVQAVSAPAAARRDGTCPGRPDGRARCTRADRPPRARQLLPRPRGLVHRPRLRRRRSGASPPSPGARPGTAQALASPGRAVHAARPRTGRTAGRGRVEPQRRAPRRRPRRAAGLLRPSRGRRS